jgi:hypothetical protein
MAYTIKQHDEGDMIVTQSGNDIIISHNLFSQEKIQKEAGNYISYTMCLTSRGWERIKWIDHTLSGDIISEDVLNGKIVTLVVINSNGYGRTYGNISEEEFEILKKMKKKELINLIKKKIGYW